ncbi:hypothetical protein GCM10027284_39960 [Cyclobacterium sediminis]
MEQTHKGIALGKIQSVYTSLRFFSIKLIFVYLKRYLTIINFEKLKKYLPQFKKQSPIDLNQKKRVK